MGNHSLDVERATTHLSDNVWTLGSHDSLILRGQLDVVGLFKALRRIGFPDDGALSLEYEANPDNPLDDMKACLAHIKQAIARSV